MGRSLARIANLSPAVIAVAVASAWMAGCLASRSTSEGSQDSAPGRTVPPDAPRGDAENREQSREMEDGIGASLAALSDHVAAKFEDLSTDVSGLDTRLWELEERHFLERPVANDIVDGAGEFTQRLKDLDLSVSAVGFSRSRNETVRISFVDGLLRLGTYPATWDEHSRRMQIYDTICEQIEAWSELQTVRSFSYGGTGHLSLYRGHLSIPSMVP